MESLGLSQKDAKFRNKWSRRIKRITGYPRFIWKKWLLCVYRLVKDKEIINIHRANKNEPALHSFFVMLTDVQCS